ncbi:c-type cytochrome [Verrucomicrobiaceae bacterium 5K15]|uniref:C-type cytochrome n=1 Tax=Oceaniferula flava TaxID=2800421 RepID=A0AAE2S9U7_9BACT|nr:c-type cytochrome [Oceaniferula flavus]MBK1854011.1 c-type cytochrome [Oceaniferula flavus]MBM1135317.1 c-type cytochrome [Oceaniferula flavus]
MKLSSHTRILLTASLSLVCLPGFAQQGNRKGHDMTDPIPIDSIPPSPYLDLDDALKSFKMAPGFVIEPVAAGEDVDMSVALSFDANGRAWSCEMRSYMPDLDGNGEQKPNGRIRVLEDTNGDGKIDRTTTFLDGLVLPRAVAVTSDGCLYTSKDVLYFIKRDGLKPVGEPVVVDAEYAIGGNPEHKANGLLLGHDNWYYNAKSNKRYRRVKGQWQIEKTNNRGQWGVAKDNAGNLYHNSNSVLLVGDVFPPMFMRGNSHYTPKARISERVGTNKTNPIHMTPGVNRAYMKDILDKDGKLANATAAAGMTIYRGDNFPASAVGMGFTTEPAGDLIKAIQIERDQWNKPKGSHPYGDKEFLASDDEWFLPCNIYTAPDGTLWIVDMYFGLLQHKTYMTSYLRRQYVHRKLDQPKPSTGRIYRVRYEKNKVSEVPKLEGLTPAQWIPYLSHANGTIRDTAQRLLVESGDLSIVDALVKVVADRTNPLAQIHAMWTLEGLDSITAPALIPALKSDHTDVVNNALNLVATLRLKDETLQKAIVSLPENTRTLHAQIKALAATGSSDEALKLTESHLKAPWVRETLISGLGAEVVSFRKEHSKLSDGKLDKLVSAATKATQQADVVKKAPGSHLKGKALESFNRGKNVYINKAACFACHGQEGEGMDNMGPPLDKSEWVTGDITRFTKILLHGMTGPITVAGKKYSPPLAMPGLKDNHAISDQDLADVITFTRNSWSNKASAGDVNEVRKVRASTQDQATPYQAKDLQ